MKSRRRHELEHNVLDAELAKIIAFFRRRGFFLACCVLVVAIVVFAIIAIHNWAVRRGVEQENLYTRLVMGDPENPMSASERQGELESLAAQTDNKRWAAGASLFLAMEYARRLLLARTAEEQRRCLDLATRYYSNVVWKFPDLPWAASQAHAGLAKLAETRGDFAAARREYQAVLSMPNLEGYPVRARAAEDLKRLEELTRPVRMSTASPQPTTGPTTQPVSTAATQPAEPAPRETQPAPVGEGGRGRERTSQPAARAAPQPTTRPAGT
jgi:predicted negative regulator of RcsB-dependent stress response